MRLPYLAAAVLAASVCLSGAPARAAGDADAGKALFNKKCALCHSPEKGTNKIGPSLYGVVGRKSGSIADFNYSDAMKNSGKTWDEPTLSAYLTNPRQYIPGVKMIFAGLPEQSDRDNVIAYLSTLK